MSSPPPAASSRGPSSPTGGGGGDGLPSPQSTEDFVVVTQPLPSVDQFAEWVQKQNLPDAHMVLKGERVKKDEIAIFVDRNSFLSDLLKPFIPKDNANAEGSPKTEAAGSEGSPSRGRAVVALDDPFTWKKVLRQFDVDLPRQAFSIGGCHHPRTAEEALLGIDEFLAQCDQEVKNRIAAFGMPRAADTEGRGWISTILNPFGFGTVTPTTPVKPKVDGFELLKRFIVLLSQQSVLAVPFEIIATQYMKANNDGQLFVGELSRAEQEKLNATMHVELVLDPKTQAPVLRILKPFRVFSVIPDTSEDITLFRIDAAIDVDLLPGAGTKSDISKTSTVTDEENSPLVLRWVIKDAIPTAESKFVARKEREEKADRASPTDQKERQQRASPAAAETESERLCECLGARAGYHKADCVFFVQTT